MTNDKQIKTALRVTLKGFAESKGIPEKMYVGVRYFVMEILSSAAMFRLDDLTERTEDGLVVSKVPVDVLITIVFDEVVCGKKEDNTVLL